MGIFKLTFVYHLPKLIGQGTASKDLSPLSAKYILWNILYVVIYICNFVWTLYTLPLREDKFGYKGYSFISQIKYCVHLYGSSIFLVIINLRVTYYRNEIRSVYKRLIEMLDDFKSINVVRRHDPLSLLFLMMGALVMTAPAALFADVAQTSRAVPVCLWVCLYLPGFSQLVYVCDYVAMFSGCSNRFLMINEALQEYAYPELSCSETFQLRKRNVRPHPLLKTLPGKRINVLDKLFILHEETSELTQILNRTCGLELVTYFTLTSATVISLSYTWILDLIAVSRGQSVSETNTKACDFWGIINILGLFSLTDAAAKVKANYGKTQKILHRLVDLYPDLEPYADFYALQLSHQNATIKAGGLFALDRTIIAGLISTWATYLIILVQFTD